MENPNYHDESDVLSGDNIIMEDKIDTDRQKFPFCIVWTPLPFITWLIPFIGHMGIAMSDGVIRDFAGPYQVSEDSMAFGKPTKYWKLSPYSVRGGVRSWNDGVKTASDIYSKRVHNLFCDNCHSHVARALNLMKYDGKESWNMFNLCFFMLLKGQSISFKSWLKTYGPSIVLWTIVICIIVGSTQIS